LALGTEYHEFVIFPMVGSIMAYVVAPTLAVIVPTLLSWPVPGETIVKLLMRRNAFVVVTAVVPFNVLTSVIASQLESKPEIKTEAAVLSDADVLTSVRTDAVVGKTYAPVSHSATKVPSMLAL
jgi:hypothetical protein